MNIIEVIRKENAGKKYKAYNGIWVLKEEANGTLELYNENEVGITSLCYVSEIINLEFEEVIDWSKVPVDTKLLVSSDGKDWYRRHFAEYKDGKVYCFNSGTTSFTAQGSEFPSGKISWEYVKLYEE